MPDWKKVRYLKEDLSDTDEHSMWLYDLVLPEPLASWDVFSYWERARVESMRDNLTDKDILFDVGSEHGWMSVVFAKFCNVFLIEPTPEFWPNIKATWEKNTDKDPVGYFFGLVGDSSTAKDRGQKYNVWPDICNGPLIDKNKYLYLHEKEYNTEIIKLDDLEFRSEIEATAVTIDVEGAELFVLKGSHDILRRGVKFWISIHPDLMKRYGHTKEDVLDKMKSYGYTAKHLATDHEEHWYFEKKK